MQECASKKAVSEPHPVCGWLGLLNYKKSSRWGKPLKQTQTLNKGGMEVSALKECGSSFNCWYARGTSCHEKKNPRKKQTEEMQNNPNLLLPVDWLIRTCRISLLFRLLKEIEGRNLDLWVKSHKDISLTFNVNASKIKPCLLFRICFLIDNSYREGYFSTE